MRVLLVTNSGFVGMRCGFCLLRSTGLGTQNGSDVQSQCLSRDDFPNIDIQVPTEVAFIHPSATDEELRKVGIEPLTPEASQLLIEKVETN